MQASTETAIDTHRYAKCIEVSKRVRWDTERDLLRGRTFDFTRKFLPDGLSKVDRLPFLSPDERRLYSQVQGRTYANMFALVERFIGAKVSELAGQHALGDQVAFEALVRLTDEELKHQALFRRMETMAAASMPGGYMFVPEPNQVAGAVLAASTWAVLALTCDIELFSQAHYRSSIEPDDELDALWKDIFLFHWREESQHAILDELEWQAENARLGAEARERAIDDLIGLVGAVDDICRLQAKADAAYFARCVARTFTDDEVNAVHATTLAAYRWQYIGSGVQNERFVSILGPMLTPPQVARIQAALAPLVA